MNSKKLTMNNKISGMNSNIPYMNTLKRFWCIVVLLAVCMGVFADNTADIKGFVHDNLTNENLTGTKVTLLKGDSIVSTTTANPNYSWMERHGLWVLENIDVASAGEYVLLFEKEGYKDKVLPLSELLGKKPLKKGERRYLGDIALDKAPKPHVLNGVTVKATKVKFYQKGDTLVYDADAFQTAEGSMLDALIKQLPGVDLVGTDTGAAPGVSSVLSNWFSDRLKLDYKVCRQVTVGAKGFVSYAHSHSQRQDFGNVSLWDFNYGLTSLISLPLQFQLSTDFTIYSRRGYANSHSNTNDVVWNARLTKSFPKLGLTLALDGFDILGNLSNISYVLNSQGRTETYRNSLPRYVMFHAIFHLNRQPRNTNPPFFDICQQQGVA